MNISNTLKLSVCDRVYLLSNLFLPPYAHIRYYFNKAIFMLKDKINILNHFNFFSVLGK